MDRATRHAYLTPTSIVVGVVTALVGFLFTLQARSADADAASERLGGVAATAATAIENRFGVARQTLVGATNLFDLVPDLSDEDFDRYVDSSIPPPGFLAWGLAHLEDGTAVVDVFHAPGLPEADLIGYDLLAKRDFRDAINAAVRDGEPKASAFGAISGFPTRSAMIVQSHEDQAIAFTIVNADQLDDRLPAELASQVSVVVSQSTQLSDSSLDTVNRQIEIADEQWNIEVRAIDFRLVPSPNVVVYGFVGTLLAMAMSVVITGGWIQRRRLRADVDSNERINEAREQFIASVSHEIRTPLTAVVGYADLLDEGWDLLGEEEKRSMVSQISEQSSEVSALVADLLVGSRADIMSLHLDVARVELRRVVDRAIASIPSDLGRNIPVSIDDARAWMADEGRATQIVRNLLVNALKYGGQNVSVETRRLPNTVVLSVVDDGDGVPMGAEESIFKPFSSIAGQNQALPSVGLGLHVSSSLAGAMGGSVTYRREDGLTAFDLELPAAEVAHPVVKA